MAINTKNASNRRETKQVFADYSHVDNQRITLILYEAALLWMDVKQRRSLCVLFIKRLVRRTYLTTRSISQLSQTVSDTLQRMVRIKINSSPGPLSSRVSVLLQRHIRLKYHNDCLFPCIQWRHYYATKCIVDPNCVRRYWCCGGVVWWQMEECFYTTLPSLPDDTTTLYAVVGRFYPVFPYMPAS